MEENKDAPANVDEVVGVGVGGADKRANSAKLSASDDISEAVPVALPLSFTEWVLSSGELLNAQPATALRSLGNSSFETPISTL